MGGLYSFPNRTDSSLLPPFRGQPFFPSTVAHVHPTRWIVYSAIFVPEFVPDFRPRILLGWLSGGGGVERGARERGVFKKVLQSRSIRREKMQWNETIHYLLLSFDLIQNMFCDALDFLNKKYVNKWPGPWILFKQGNRGQLVENPKK